MVETAVLHHDDYNMLDIQIQARSARQFLGQQRSCGSDGRGCLQKVPAIHLIYLRRVDSMNGRLFKNLALKKREN
jgi:hypothetical protein